MSETVSETGSEMGADTAAVKDRIVADFQKVKAEERLRAERVQDIVRKAFSQTIAEVKDGSGEMRTIAQDAFGTVKQEFTVPFKDGSENLSGQKILTVLQQRFEAVDATATDWYNARCGEMKKRLAEKGKTWYVNNLQDEQRAGLETRFTEVKTTWTAKEEQLRQRLKDLLARASASL